MLRVIRCVSLLSLPVIVLTACTGQSEENDSANATVEVVRMITHESFALSEDLLAELAQSGIDLQITATGDAGSMTAAAVLAAGAPTADLIFGVDNTLITRAVGEGVFEEYESPERENLRAELRDQTSGGLVTPITFGDVCINVDKTWFEKEGIAAPTALEELPAFADQLVVQDPGTSSPGLAFVLATVDRFGESWPQYWEDLRDGGVRVAGSWTDAYYTDFTLSGGDRPLVVSYATSPAAEVLYSEDASVTQPTTASINDSCYRQVEFAGVLAGAQNPTGAQRVIDWLLSEPVQEDIPLSMFVYPVRENVTLPDAFAQFTPVVETSASIPTEQVSAQLSEILTTWGEVMGR